MGNGQVGGDGSVKWTFEAENVKGTPQSKPKGPKGHEQWAVDDTAAGEKFSVAIKLPSTTPDFVALRDRLEQWVKNPQDPIEFELPIEDGNEKQIVIKWKSKP
jgi:hypothetical protein